MSVPAQPSTSRSPSTKIYHTVPNETAPGHETTKNDVAYVSATTTGGYECNENGKRKPVKEDHDDDETSHDNGEDDGEEESRYGDEEDAEEESQDGDDEEDAEEESQDGDDEESAEEESQDGDAGQGDQTDEECGSAEDPAESQTDDEIGSRGSLVFWQIRRQMIEASETVGVLYDDESLSSVDLSDVGDAEEDVVEHADTLAEAPSDYVPAYSKFIEWAVNDTTDSDDSRMMDEDYTSDDSSDRSFYLKNYTNTAVMRMKRIAWIKECYARGIEVSLEDGDGSEEEPQSDEEIQSDEVESDWWNGD